MPAAEYKEIPSGLKATFPPVSETLDTAGVCHFFFIFWFSLSQAFRQGLTNTAIMGKSGFMKNYRVYILTSVAYLGSLLFGSCYQPSFMESVPQANAVIQDMTRVSWAQSLP